MRARLHHEKPKLFRRMTVRLCERSHSKDSKDRVRSAVEKPDHRRHDLRENAEWSTDDFRDTFRIYESERFRRELSEDDMKEGQEEKAERESNAAVHAVWCRWQPEQSEEAVDEDCHRRLTNPAECERSDGDSQLRARDVSVEMSECALALFCTAVAGLRHLVDAAAPDSDECELRGDEKRVEGYQKQNDTKAGGDFTGAKVFGRTLKKGQEIHIR